MRKLAVFGTVCIALFAAVCLHASPAIAGDSAPEVGVTTITPGNVKLTQELNGRVTPFLIAEVRPQVNGIILRRLFEEGSVVKQDEPLYQIDPALYDAQHNRSQAGVIKAKANLDVARAKLARYEKLIEAKAVNQQEFDEVEAASKQAEAEVGIAAAEERLTKINLDYARVVSPITGIIGKSAVTQGALVTASQAEPLATVQKLDPIYVDVNQPVSWLLSVRQGMDEVTLENTGKSLGEVKLMLENGQTYEHVGKILFADVTVDQSTGSISIRCEFPNPDYLLLPGMYVKAVMEIANLPNAITVPQRALTRNSAGEGFVLVVRDDDTVERRLVTTQRTLGDKWLIAEGLKAGERVVVDGSQRIRFSPNDPNPKVKPVAAE